MATKTVPGDKPTSTSSVTSIAPKRREAALCLVLGEIVGIAHSQLALLELGAADTNDDQAEAVMVAAAQLTRTVGQLADRARQAHGDSHGPMRHADDWCFSDDAMAALHALEGRNEEAA